MKFTAIFLLAACMQVSARGYSQQVSIDTTNASLVDVFHSIRDQTGYLFIYDLDMIREAHPVEIHVRHAPLEDVLRQCFLDQPLTYTIVEKTIVVKKRQAELISVIPTTIPPNDIHGRVIDSLGNPLAGASVTVKGSKKGTQTDVNGRFNLKNADPNATLIISFTGYVSREINVQDQHLDGIRLQVSNNDLDQLQIIAYGTTTRRFDVGNVTDVKGADIEKQPVDNLLLALEGRVPGLIIKQTTGLPGSGVNVTVQGQNSINNGNDPFYVIDGVPYTSGLLPNLGNILGASGLDNNGSALSFINPSDIESISVLKDADATAIYGTRAANGAILITTKRGKEGATKVDLNMQNGWGKITRKLNLLNGPQYLQMRREAIRNDGLTIGPGDYDLNGTWDTTRNTDWQKELIGGTSQYTNLTATISGGTINTQYLIGGTFNRQTTVFPGNLYDQKGSVNFNINSSSVNKKFHVNLSGSYLIGNNHLVVNDLTGYAVELAPDAPALYNKDGSVNWGTTSSGTSSFSSNPIIQLFNIYHNKTTNLIGNLVLDYQLLPGLTIRSNFGYTNMQSNELTGYPLTAVAPENRLTSSRIAQYANNGINSWIVEPQLEYKSVFGKGRLDLLVGSSIQQNNSNGLIMTGVGFSSDDVIENIQAAPSVSVANSIISTYKYSGLFGRVNYIYDEKYLVDITARRDGSSRFGAANEFHNFGAVGAGWIFSNEKFINKIFPFLSFGKIKVSYGLTGNDQIGDYKYLSLFYPTYGQVAYQGAPGLAPVGLSNPYLQWEETRKLNLGASLGFLKDRILMNVDYARNRCSNQLVPSNVSILTGFPNIILNFPATVQNTSLEFSLRTINVNHKKFQWSTNFNLTVPRNKLVAFPGLANSTYSNALVIGKSLSVAKLFHFLGVDPATGIYQFADAHGNATTNPDPVLDRTVLLDRDPRFYGGMDNTLSYGRLHLSFLLQFIKQKGFNVKFGNIMPGAFNINQPTSVLSRWRSPNDVTSIQRYNSDYSLIGNYINANSSDGWFTDASFIRLKNVSLSYSWPEQWQKRLKMQNCRFYIQAQNLLTFTRYIGADPETQATIALPPLRVVTLGIEVGL